MYALVCVRVCVCGQWWMKEKRREEQGGFEDTGWLPLRKPRTMEVVHVYVCGGVCVYVCVRVYARVPWRLCRDQESTRARGRGSKEAAAFKLSFQ